jgi:hypothetical protein
MLQFRRKGRRKDKEGIDGRAKGKMKNREGGTERRKGERGTR